MGVTASSVSGVGAEREATAKIPRRKTRRTFTLGDDLGAVASSVFWCIAQAGTT
jgi:hypothetical protein